MKKALTIITAAAMLASLPACGKRKLNAVTEAWLFSNDTPAETAQNTSAVQSTPTVWTPAPQVTPSPSPAYSASPAPVPGFEEVPTATPTPVPALNPEPTPILQEIVTTMNSPGWVNGDSVNFRELPGTTAYVFCSYDKGKDLTILGSGDGWTKVRIDGTEGYIKSEYVTDSFPLETHDHVETYKDSSIIVGNGQINLSYVQSRIIQLTNAQRAAYGLPALAYDERLQNTADLRAAEQAVLFSHTRPDGSDWSTAFPASTYYFLGENLATCDVILADESFATSCVKWWMESEDHRANILNESFTVIAVGIAIEGDCMYATQEFGTPF